MMPLLSPRILSLRGTRRLCCTVAAGKGADRKRRWRHNQPGSPYYLRRFAASASASPSPDEQALRDAVLPSLPPDQRQAAEARLALLCPSQRLELLRQLGAGGCGGQ
ncbi:hypothetical protein HYH03_006415 [Edaphochlamys debaryana]|uniref:Uncharacterized protein n=1 Tax=Edaphochlamys debaryana TaxID=47281 RepID=A0A835YAR8_9CHLO|nr:hypothetical protein HYH03_006415 [Edaphochlamys debaryana]|eukprot:KAG2495470.1 hypothetical protein HYH03_006415 [Edaphochlamys debaryana]